VAGTTPFAVGGGSKKKFARDRRVIKRKKKLKKGRGVLQKNGTDGIPHELGKWRSGNANRRLRRTDPIMGWHKREKRKILTVKISPRRGGPSKKTEKRFERVQKVKTDDFWRDKK